MAEVETIKIKDEGPSGYRVINKTDFAEGMEEFVEGDPETSEPPVDPPTEEEPPVEEPVVESPATKKGK